MYNLYREEISPIFAKFSFVLYLVWSDTKARYKRSFLGPLWLTLGAAVSIGGIAFVWSKVFQRDIQEMLPSLSVGLVVWMFLSGSIAEAPEVFLVNRDKLLNVKISSYLFTLGLLLKYVVNFLHQIVFVFIVFAFYNKAFFSLTSFLSIIGFFLVFLNLFWIVHIFAFLGARFRDISPLVNAVLQPLFFITPVLFRPDIIGVNNLIILLNPLAYFLAVIRDPMMGKVPSLTVWIVVIAMAIIGNFVAWLFTLKRRYDLAYLV